LIQFTSASALTSTHGESGHRRGPGTAHAGRIPACMEGAQGRPQALVENKQAGAGGPAAPAQRKGQRGRANRGGQDLAGLHPQMCSGAGGKEDAKSALAGYARCIVSRLFRVPRF